MQEEHAVPFPPPADISDLSGEEDTADPSDGHVDIPTSQPVIPPAPLGVPETSEITAPSLMAPAIEESSATESAADSAADDDDLLAPSASVESTTPEPLVEPASLDETDDLFGEPALPAEVTASAEAPAQEETPLPEATQAGIGTEEPTAQPQADADELFGPPEPEELQRDDPIEPEKQPDASEEPAPVEPRESYDPFDEAANGLEDETSVLTTAGGLQSKFERTWSDDTDTYECQARLLRVTSKNVVLQQSTGDKLVVPLSRLANDDLHFVLARFRQFDFKCSFTTRGYGDAKLAWHQAQPSGPRLPYSF